MIFRTFCKKSIYRFLPLKWRFFSILVGNIFCQMKVKMYLKIYFFNFSCQIDDRNPFEDLFDVLKNPKVVNNTRRFTERDLPKSFFNPRHASLNPKREEQIKQARLGHFQSLRRIRNKSENEPIKSHTLSRINETTVS